MAADIKDTADLSAPRDVSEITRDNQLNSPLLRLPGEIRNRIYEYTFFDAKVMVTDPDWDWNGRVPWRNERPNHVLAICQQIRHEATSIFWNECMIQPVGIFFFSEVASIMGVSNCARITSLYVNMGLAFDGIVFDSTLPVPYPLADFPLLRKLKVNGVFFRPKNEDEDAILRCIRAKGVEVDCMDHEFGLDPRW
ncbi:hypothetical protein J4E93_008065 [Alternaria ventricosa]|uniref:uncharacterized protein n=1 Tax=Alternaria ventricosa TaxID=1187951 RepID=UPI0020C1BE94|nr:uncharacterized protein J4E93_008065 [Alternaria ventricosa]KAI4641186.1 hypothetical protein J4E93_008065 [Alternaria ventricosa]